MKLIVLIIFLVINFTGLFIGALYTGEGVGSEWYQDLNKAPWTPPGWFFGVAWTTIMICFSLYMTKLIKVSKRTSYVLLLFVILWMLNVIWNPVFFYWQDAVIGLTVITLLTILIGGMLFLNRRAIKSWSLLLLPYFVWLCVATSLNLFIVIYN
ncbi:MAG: tryptophan-rich sensory protein [Crocinitomicaceae bacterium]|nr:tryptophan-rich sensory protein [Crocinitomicaceae bacterium]